MVPQPISSEFKLSGNNLDRRGTEELFENGNKDSLCDLILRFSFPRVFLL